MDIRAQWEKKVTSPSSPDLPDPASPWSINKIEYKQTNVYSCPIDGITMWRKRLFLVTFKNPCFDYIFLLGIILRTKSTVKQCLKHYYGFIVNISVSYIILSHFCVSCRIQQINRFVAFIRI